MAGDFAVNLGAGVYIDSSGRVTNGAPPNAQIFDAPEGFKIDPKKLQDTFKDLSGILPKSKEDQAQWIEWGAPPGLVSALAKVAGVTTIVATSISVYFWAIGAAMTLIGMLSDKGEANAAVTQAFNAMKALYKAGEERDRIEAMVARKADFESVANKISAKLMLLNTTLPTGDARQAIYNDMHAIVDELSVPLAKLCSEPWLGLFDHDDYKARAFLSHVLVTIGADGALKPVEMNGPALAFDCRPGVPMLHYGFLTFVSAISATLPWYRSSGIYAPRLRQCADAIDTFVLKMQTEVLARIEHTWQSIMFEQQMPTPWFGGFRPNDLLNHYYPVGAFDLAQYNDAWISNTAAYNPPGTGIGVRGSLDYGWQTDADGPDAIAAAANERSRAAYAELQTATGMFSLINLAGMLRHLSTPSIVSETVTGRTYSSRIPLSEEPTTAKSPVIFPSTVIESPATLKHFQGRFRAPITTQPPGSVAPIHYSIFLRTVDSKFGNDGWFERDYVGEVWKPEYVQERPGSKDKRLETTLPRPFLADVRLYDGPAPTDALAIDGSVTIQASTFDWYVPDLSRFNPYLDLEIDDQYVSAAYARKSMSKMAMRQASGGLSIHAWEKNMKHLPGTVKGPLLDKTDAWGEDILYVEESLARAERRHVRNTEANLKWTLSWSDGQLLVTLVGEPEQRPFQAYIVIEERVFSGLLPGEGENPAEFAGGTVQIHTPFKAEIVNQLLLVPERFFREEQQALDWGEKLWKDTLDKYTEERPLGPEDPIAATLDDVRKQVEASPSTSTIVHGLNTRLKFMQQAMPEFFEAHMRGVRAAE